MEQLDYNPETGELRWNDKAQKKMQGKPANRKDSKGYVYLHVGNKMILGHRIAWFKHYGKWPDGVIDHINGDPADNRICNLRDVPQPVNMQNQRKPRADNKLGLLGVSMKGNRFRAQITVNQKKKMLGTFATAEEAHLAYVTAKRELHIGGTL